MSKPTVAVLRGGATHEYDVSLNSGARALAALESRGYQTRDVYLDRTGRWHFRGMPLTPERALTGTDVVLPMIHGAYGEDGGLSRELERMQVPYVGSRALAGAATFNKVRTKEQLALHSVLTPLHKVLKVSPNLDEDVLNLFRSMLMPVVVKPVSGGSSIGASLASSFAELSAAVTNAFQYDAEVLIEEYIKGRELTLGVIEGFRGEPLYVTPAVEVTPLGIYSYLHKRTNAAPYRAPAPLSSDDRRRVTELARTVFVALDVRGMATVDIILGKRGPYLLEINTVPGIGEHAPLTRALESVGASIDQVLSHLIDMRLKK